MTEKYFVILMKQRIFKTSPSFILASGRYLVRCYLVFMTVSPLAADLK